MSELADPDLGCCKKNEATSLDLKRSGNLCFRSRDFDDALRFYSKALRVAPPDAFDGDKSLLASLFLNRANVLHVFSLFFLFYPVSSLNLFLAFSFSVAFLMYILCLVLESWATQRELAGLPSCSPD